MTAQFVMRRRVEFSDTDMAGIVHFSSYYRYMEQTEHAFFRSLGLSIMETRPDGTVIGWPRVSASCSFEAPARFEDELDVHLIVERKGVKSLTMRYEFHRAGQRIAHGRMKIACCICRHNAPLESIPIPEHIDRLIAESAPAENAAST